MSDSNVRWLVVTDARTLPGLERVLPDTARLFDYLENEPNDRGRYTISALVVVADLGNAQNAADNLAGALAAERMHADVYTDYAEAHEAWNVPIITTYPHLLRKYESE